MSVFGRRSGVPSVLPVWAPFSSIGYYRQLLRQVGSDLDGRGLAHTVQSDAVTVRLDSNAARLDMRALTQVVADRPVREWPALVAEQLDRLVTGVRESTQFVADAQPLAKVRDVLALRLVGDHAEAAERAGIVRPLAPGIATQLVYRLPGTVATVPDAHLRTWGLEADALVDLAMANTRGLVQPIVARAHDTQKRYDVLADSNPLTASALLCLDEVVGPLAPYGVLLGVPSAHELVAHVVTNRDGADAVLRELPESLHRRHARVPEPLSPLLYWWRAEEVHHVPTAVENDTLVASPPAPLAEILNVLPPT